MDGEAHVPRYSNHVSTFLNEINQDVTLRERATQEHEHLTRSRLNAIKQKKKIEEKIKKMIQDLENQNEVITACQVRLFQIEQQYPESSLESEGVCARLAQLVRSLTANQKVPGSIPGLVEG